MGNKEKQENNKLLKIANINAKRIATKRQKQQVSYEFSTQICIKNRLRIETKIRKSFASKNELSTRKKYKKYS